MSNILIATPMYGGQCYSNYVAGVIENVLDLKTHGHEVTWISLTNESLITRGRNTLTDYFLKGRDFTHLMFIDADIGFPNDAIRSLLESDEDIVGALYPKKEVSWDNIKRAAEAGKIDELEKHAGSFVLNVDAKESQTNDKGLISVRHVGTGFMLIKKSVFQKLAPGTRAIKVSASKPFIKEFFTTSPDKSGVLLSEDFHFCQSWLDVGGKIYANPFIKLNHTGTYIYNGDILIGGGNLK